MPDVRIRIVARMFAAAATVFGCRWARQRSMVRQPLAVSAVGAGRTATRELITRTLLPHASCERSMTSLPRSCACPLGSSAGHTVQYTVDCGLPAISLASGVCDTKVKHAFNEFL